MVLSCSPCNTVYLTVVPMTCAAGQRSAAKACWAFLYAKLCSLVILAASNLVSDASAGLTKVHEVLAVGGTGYLGYLGRVEGGARWCT